LLNITNKIFNELQQKSNTRNFTDIKDGDILYIYGFKLFKNSYGNQIILVYSTKEILTLQTPINTIWAPLNIKIYLEKCKRNFFRIEDLVERNNLPEYYQSITQEPIIYLQKLGNNVKILNIRENNNESIEETKTLSILSSCNKLTNCKKLDKLEEGQKLTIIAFREIENCKNKVYILQTEEEGLISSSYFLTEAIKDKLEEGNSFIKIIIGPFKTTPSKNKARVIYV
jgi:hypothetical protein